MMFIIRWWIFFFTWIVRSCMLNYVKQLMLVNAYMLIDWDVVGEYIYVNWIVNVVGDFIYVKWWWIVGEYTYAKWLVNECNWWITCWWIICVNICIVVESYVHAYMTDGDGFLYPNCKTGVKSYIRCFCCIWVTTLLVMVPHAFRNHV